MKLLLTIIIILMLTVSIIFANENDFIQNQTFYCKDYISQSMKGTFSVNGLSSTHLMNTACTKKEIMDNLSEQEKNHLKELTIKVDEAKKTLSQKELDNLVQQENTVNDNWEWFKNYIKPKDLSQLNEQEIKNLDSELRSIFKKMRKALHDGDIETALTFFHHRSRERYREIFSALSPSALKESSSEEVVLNFGGLLGEYEIKYEVITNRKSEKMSFMLIFSQDNGRWKIYKY